MSQYGVILFFTTSSAIQSEKMLLKESFAVKLIPVPRELSSDCGIALRFDWDDMERVTLVLVEAKVETDSVHRLP